MSNQGDPRTGADQPVWRRHDGDGLSQEALRLIKLHGLRRSKVLECADHYALEEGIDFNHAPTRDFKDAPLGQVLANTMGAEPAFGPYLDKFNDALGSFDYATSDGIVDKCLINNMAVIQAWKILYDEWREYAERLEGFNVALFRAARITAELHRFILDFGELGNYLRGGGACLAASRTGCRRQWAYPTSTWAAGQSPRSRTTQAPSGAGYSQHGTRRTRATLTPS